MLGNLGVKLQVQKDQSGLEIPAKRMFKNSNERIIEEMKKKPAPLIEEYNKNIN